MKTVCIVVWMSVAREARKANRWSSNWWNVPMIEKAAYINTPTWERINSRLSSSISVLVSYHNWRTFFHQIKVLMVILHPKRFWQSSMISKKAKTLPIGKQLIVVVTWTYFQILHSRYKLYPFRVYVWNSKRIIHW